MRLQLCQVWSVTTEDKADLVSYSVVSPPQRQDVADL